MKTHLYVITFSLLVSFELFGAPETDDQEVQYERRIIGSLANTIPEDSPEYLSLHSAFIELNERSSKESVPLLIGYLKHAPRTRGIQCTWIHLHDALKAQTGEDFGFSREEWQQWWDEKGKDLPESHFNTNSNKKKNLERYRANLPAEVADLIAILSSHISSIDLNENLRADIFRIIQNLENVRIDRKIERGLPEIIVKHNTLAWQDTTRFSRALRRRLVRKSPMILLSIQSATERIETFFDRSDKSVLSISVDLDRE